MTLTVTPTTLACLFANQNINIANSLVKNHTNAKANGITIRGIAFTADDYATALGEANMAVLDAIAAANPHQA